MRQLLNIVHYRIQLPLRVDFVFTPEGKAIHVLVIANITERQFNRAQALAVAFSPDRAVDLVLHAFEGGVTVFGLFEEDDLSGAFLVFVSEALGSEVTVFAGGFWRGELDSVPAVDADIASVAVEAFPCWTGAGLQGDVIFEVLWGELFLWPLLGFVLVGVCEPRVSLAEAVVGDVTVAVFRFEPFDGSFTPSIAKCSRPIRPA